MVVAEGLVKVVHGRRGGVAGLNLLASAEPIHMLFNTGVQARLALLLVAPSHILPETSEGALGATPLHESLQ